MARTAVLWLCLLAIYTSLTSCSLYDPHPFPGQGPFVEGWYFRFIDFASNRSFALLFGSVKPENASVAEKLAFVGLLLGENGKSLKTYDSFPPLASFNLTVKDGRPVTAYPDVTSPCDFTLNIPSMGHLRVTSNRTEVDLVVDTVHLKASVGTPVPWGPDGLGPAGWVQYFSRFLPLNWFVFSLRSPLVSYKWMDIETGTVLSGDKGYVHMEKNWGNSFPTAWIWTEAVHEKDHSITYALAYGPLGFSSLEVDGFLFGYRNPKKNLVVDMTPAGAWMSRSSKTDGCNSSISVTMTSFTHKVQLEVQGKPSTFSKCLYCPKKNGFRKASVETYSASADLKVYKRTFWSYEQVDHQQFNGYAALEFGGTFMCKKCSE